MKIFNEIRDHCNCEQKLNCGLIDLMTQNIFLQIYAAIGLVTHIHKELKPFFGKLSISFHSLFRWNWRSENRFLFFIALKSLHHQDTYQMICNLRTDNNIATTFIQTIGHAEAANIVVKQMDTIIWIKNNHRILITTISSFHNKLKQCDARCVF